MSELLGKEIIKLRKELKMTQLKLCSGICSQGMISLIEKGNIMPGVEIISALSIRLNVPLTHLTNLIHSKETYLNYDLINQVESYLNSHNYKKIYKISTDLINSNAIGKGWMYCYMKWLHYLSGYYIKKYPFEIALNNLKKLCDTTNEFELNKDYLSERIYNSMAILYIFKGDYYKANFYFNKINLNFNEQNRFFDPDKVLLKIIYNKTKMLFDIGELESAVKNALEGIDISIKLENMSLIGQLYFYLGESYEKLGEPLAKIKTCYQKSLFYFETLNKVNYLKILKEEKMMYL